MRSFLFGLLFGAIAGILYAPASGNRTRSMVKDKLVKYSNDTVDFVDDKSKVMSEGLNGFSERVSTVLGDLRQRLNGLLSTVQQGVEELQEQSNSPEKLPRSA